MLLNEIEYSDENVGSLIENFQSLIPDVKFHPFKINKIDAVATIEKIIGNHEFDIYINLCDGSPYCKTAGIEVVPILEKRNVAFTGASSHFYDPSRLAMKMVAHSVGVKFPRYVLVEHSKFNLEHVLDELSFPMFVKPPQGANSYGLSPNSLVKDLDALKTQIELIVRAYGAALVEEFIEGREFTVLVQEDPNSKQSIVYSPLECVLDGASDFKHYQKKWIDFNDINWQICENQVLASKLKQASIAIFNRFEGDGYARLDFRVDLNGNVYLLEINPNCGIFGWSNDTFCSADLILIHDKARHSFCRLMIEGAKTRQQENMSKIMVKFNDNDGFHLRSRQLIKKDENIYAGTKHGECQNYRLISKAMVDKTWNDEQKKLFQQYAWPLNQEIFVIWSANSENWLPIQHSCEPNSVMHFLNLIAIKDIQENEPITVDYITFNNEEMLNFTCNCQSNNCRTIIKGFSSEDSEFIKRVYSEAHVSSFIKTQIIK